MGPRNLTYFQAVSEDLQNYLDEIAHILVNLQDQLDSLAAVMQQNHKGLDLLTTEKGGLCLFLDEQYFFYLNQFGLVRDAAKTLRDCAQKIQERQTQWSSWLTTKWPLGFFL